MLMKNPIPIISDRGLHRPLTNIAGCNRARAGIDSAHPHRSHGWLLEPRRSRTNIRSDPEAAAIVFNSGVEISMVGFDITRRCELSPSHLQQIGAASTRSTQLLQQLIELWQDGTRRMPVLNDPLAIMAIFDDCITWEDKCIEVALCGEQRGCTLVSNSELNARVAVDVDATRAIELCLARLLK
jgi:inosine-uridine nucleoside N-ribohydrolase